jgi:nitrogenase molybdenum-iron protein beta chain
MSGLIEQARFTCAIGAMQSVVAIPRALPILHSGPGCGTMVSGFFERAAGYAGGGTAPCTNFSEAEVVFGGEEKLRSIIESSYKVLKSDLQVVLTGCTADIVGDDTSRVVKSFRDAGKPIVHAETAGFKSSNFVSHSVVVNAIVDQFVGDGERCSPGERSSPIELRSTMGRTTINEPGLVNIFASVPYQDPFWKGNLSELKRLLEGIGLRVNLLFGPESRGVAEWKTIPAAQFNVLVSPWYGLPIVEHLKEKYGQPWFRFPYIPIGGNETTKFLRALAEFSGSQAGFPLDQGRVDAFIAREEEEFYMEIQSLATFLLEFRYGLPAWTQILHDASYVVGMSKFLLHEVGIVPKELFVVDGTPEEFHAEVRANLASASDKRAFSLTFEPDAGRAQQAVRAASHQGRGLLIGSGWEKALAREKGLDYLSAANPSPVRLVLTTGYLGYRGGLRLVEDIYDRVLATYA